MLHTGKLRQGALLQGRVSVPEVSPVSPSLHLWQGPDPGHGAGKPRGVGGTQNTTLTSFSMALQGCARPCSGLLGDSQTCCARCFPGTERPEQR